MKLPEEEMVYVTRAIGGQDCLAFLLFIGNKLLCIRNSSNSSLGCTTFFLTDSVVMNGLPAQLLTAAHNAVTHVRERYLPDASGT